MTDELRARVEQVRRSVEELSEVEWRILEACPYEYDDLSDYALTHPGDDPVCWLHGTKQKPGYWHFSSGPAVDMDALRRLRSAGLLTVEGEDVFVTAEGVMAYRQSQRADTKNP